MARWMPRLEAYFHYRNLDVSTLKELARRWKPDGLPIVREEEPARGAGGHLRVDRRTAALPDALAASRARLASPCRRPRMRKLRAAVRGAAHVGRACLPCADPGRPSADPSASSTGPRITPMKPNAMTPPSTPRKIMPSDKRRAARDQYRLEEVVDAADDDGAPDHHEDRPAGLALHIEPDRCGAPDQHRTHRHDGQHEGRDGEHERRRARRRSGSRSAPRSTAPPPCRRCRQRRCASSR